MTNQVIKNLNVFLPKVAVVFTIITILFIIICQVIIGSFFYFNKSVIKQRYKSIVSFKILRITLGMFIFMSSYVSLIFVPRLKGFRGLATPFPFIIGFVGNLILLVFLRKNEDAWKYFLINIKSFMDRIKLDFERRNFRKKSTRNKVFPQLLENIGQGEQNETIVDERQNVSVPDVDNAESESHI
jgi:hypothetical protein